MSAVVEVDTQLVAILLACWIAAAAVGLVGVIWMARQWRWQARRHTRWQREAR